MAAIEEQEPTMHLIPLWFKRSRKAPLHQHRCRHNAPIEVPELEEDEKPLGCGWFDSSHELQRGLVIIETEVAAIRRLH
jgi:hypothetical protein